MHANDEVNGQYDSDSDRHVFGLNCKPNSDKPKCKMSPKATITIEGVQVKMGVDSCASATIIDEHSYKKMGLRVHLKSDATKIFPYGQDQPLRVIGSFWGKVAYKSRQTQAPIFVVEGNYGCILDYSTSRDLGLIKLFIDEDSCSEKVDQLTADCKPSLRVNDSDTKAIVNEFADRFQGLGKMKNYKVRLHIDHKVKPKALPHRRIPFHTRKKVEQEIKKLLDMDIIERVYGPTPWVSPLVTCTKPNGDLRICVDMRHPNEAIIRERHPMPTVDDIIHDLNGAQYFSKLDLCKGYHQLELEAESRYITTFSTHLGLFRYKRLNFGTNSAAEQFQEAIRSLIRDIQGTINLSDDILVYAKTKEEHDKILRRVLQKLRDNNITLNPDKCEFNKSTLKYYGYIFSAKGMTIDPDKVSAIVNAPAPINPEGVRSFLGMVQYCTKFMPNLASISKPLRDLTVKNVKWSWGSEESAAFNKIKETISNTRTLAYFDPEAETHLYVDAGPHGLGAILAQKTKQEYAVPVAYASRALNTTEQRYSQLEKEMLSIIWGCEHFKLYIYGAPVKIFSDHKPLVQILNNPNAQPSARIERWHLQMQRYDYTIQHIPGLTNPADYLSRHLSKTATENSKHQEMANKFVNMLVNDALPKAITMQELITEVNADSLLTKVKEALQTNNWTEEIKSTVYYAIRTELTTDQDQGILLKGHRIVIPEKLENRTIQLGHVGHQGETKTKTLLREKVWFPKMDIKVTEYIKSCVACQASTSPNKSTKTPLEMSPLPPGPWLHVSIDFLGPIMQSKYVLVLIDEYSRYPVVSVVKSTMGDVVIPRLKEIFAMFGTPSIIKTDNGPPFSSEKFREFSIQIGSKHRRITPYWPNANAEAERFMKPLMKAIRTAYITNVPWEQALSGFLQNYRSTPHPSTGKPPAELMFGRNLKTGLPQLTPKLEDIQVRRHDNTAKAKMKFHADKNMHKNRPMFQEGDKVLVSQVKRNKMMTPYNPKPYRVVRTRGTMVTAACNGHQITRNQSHFKLLERNKSQINASKQPVQENKTPPSERRRRETFDEPV